MKKVIAPCGKQYDSAMKAAFHIVITKDHSCCEQLQWSSKYAM